ncbi:MAG: recombinase family protein [Planctomycetota bacterium]
MGPPTDREGVRIERADRVPHAKTPEGRLLRDPLDAFAEYERSMIRARTVAALRARRERGLRFTLHPPYGWRFVGGRMVADPAQQKTLVRMRTLRSRGETYRAIGARLLAEGRRPARAKAWSIGMVRSLVHRAPPDGGAARRGA